MIIPYASDEEYEGSKYDHDITIITDKDIKIETSEVSEDHVKPDNLFAFDVNFYFNKKATYIKLFKDNSNNQSDDQFLKKFENLKIQNDDNHHRFHGIFSFFYSIYFFTPFLFSLCICGV